MLPDRGEKFEPTEDYLKKYKWRFHATWISSGPVALVTHNKCDIFIELVDGVPHFLHPDENPEIYDGFTSSTKFEKYVRMWTKSGFYRSLHLKEFLNQVAQ